MMSPKCLGKFELSIPPIDPGGFDYRFIAVHTGGMFVNMFVFRLCYLNGRNARVWFSREKAVLRSLESDTGSLRIEETLESMFWTFPTQAHHYETV